MLSHCPMLSQQLELNDFKNQRLKKITDMIKVLIIQTLNPVND